jgi:hypothetical protein
MFFPFVDLVEITQGLQQKSNIELSKDNKISQKMKIMRQYLTNLTPVQFATKSTNGKNI